MQTVTGDVRSVPEQISELRDNCPHSIALSYGDQELNYEELDCRANRFAGHLMQLGIAPGDTVAICMERSFDWIVAALGIMRASAAYVPLDSAWPNSRLRFAVKDSGATALVARAELLDRIQVKARGIDPCRDAAAIAAAPGVARRPVDLESFAYVIYTSGSTGVPKGVEITHANLGHLIRWHRDTFRVTRQDRASHLAGLGFDAAVWEIFIATVRHGTSIRRNLPRAGQWSLVPLERGCAVAAVAQPRFAQLDEGAPLVRSVVKHPIVIDGRNLYRPAEMARAGFIYYSIGRPVALPKSIPVDGKSDAMHRESTIRSAATAGWRQEPGQTYGPASPPL